MLKIGEVIQTLKGLVETKIEMVKRDIQEEIFGILSRVILIVLMGGSLLLFLLFMSLSLAFYLSQYFGTPFMGFFLVGILYLVIMLILYVTKESDSIQNKMQLTLSNFILKSKLKKLKDENEK